MNKKAILIVILLITVISLGGYKFLSLRSSAVSGLKVASTPTASVFLNDKLVGKTPYDDKHPPGEYVIKLIPDDTSGNTTSWQGKITLNPYLLTYVKRELGASELTSGGEILYLGKSSAGGETQIDISSQPDGASVTFDGQEKGTTPLLLRDVLGGEHDISVSSAGFVSRTVRAQATSGYKLNIIFQLVLVEGSELPTAVGSSVSPTPAPTGKGETKQTNGNVIIKDTPNGFLRVRNGPSISNIEIARVKPKENYPLLEEKEGWYKISYAEGKEGWISGDFADKTE